MFLPCVILAISFFSRWKRSTAILTAKKEIMAHIALTCGRNLFIFLAVYFAKYVISHGSISHFNSLCLAFLLDLICLLICPVICPLIWPLICLVMCPLICLSICPLIWPLIWPLLSPVTCPLICLFIWKKLWYTFRLLNRRKKLLLQCYYDLSLSTVYSGYSGSIGSKGKIRIKRHSG